MITTENDYKPIIYEQPFTSHIYEFLVPSSQENNGTKQNLKQTI